MTVPRSGKVNAHAFAQLIKALAEGPYSRLELSEITGLHPLTVGHYVNELRRAGQVFIQSWDQPADGGRNSVAFYALGHQRDAKRGRLTEAQRSARYREAKKSKQPIFAGMTP